VKETALPPYDDELNKRLMKHFAEIEMGRRRSEELRRTYNARERIKEDEDKEKERLEREKEDRWAEIEKREERVNHWREFQEVPDSKRLRMSSYKEERRTETKHGVVQLEEWKKNWK
jgi:hypothetical protein